ncbi:hypothetical protein OBJ96_13230 [Empedobacter falsenii]
MGTRIIKISKDLNITVERAMEFLISKGYDIERNPYTKISENLKQLLLNEFDLNSKIKTFITNKKNVVNETIEVKNNYEYFKKNYYEEYQEFSLRRNKLLQEIDILNNILLKEKEIDDLILRKKNEITELLDEYEIAIEQFAPNLLYEDNYDQNLLDDYNDDYDEDYDYMKENRDDDSDYNQQEWSNYTSDNPWRDVFGDSDEAETAYWNTD